MATERRMRLSSSRRVALKNLLRLVPVVVVLALMLDTLSCSNNGLLPQGNSSAPAATPSAGTGALAFVTNFNDGEVSSFTRNVASGVLKRSGQVPAGKKMGPKGVVASPSGSFLYVANFGDGNIYQFSINSGTGVLTPLNPPSVSNGNKSGPDELAINPAGTFLWATGNTDGTVTTYAIDSVSGLLTQNSQVTRLSNPFGIVADTTGTYVYVADNGSGLVYSYSIGAAGALTQIGAPVSDLGPGGGGTPGFIAIDPAGTYIYVTDLNAGVIGILKTTAGALSFGGVQPMSTSANLPIGIGYATVSTVGNFLFTANQASSSLWSSLVTSPGFPSSPVEFGMGDLSAPTGLVVDPQNAFLYTTNQNAGTVSQFQLSPACFAAGAPCFVSSIATENPASRSSGPFGITLAQ